MSRTAAGRHGGGKTARPFDPRQSMHRQDFEIFHYHDPKMQEVPLHDHDFYEIYDFLGGNVEYLAEGGSYRLLPEDILLIRPGVLHRPKVAPGEAYERIVLWIDASYLEGIDGDGEVRRMFGGPGGMLLHGAGAGVSQLMRHLAGEFYADDAGSGLLSRGLFYQVMAELVRLSGKSGGVEEATEDLPLAERVMEYLSVHYREEISLDVLAERFYVSKYHLSHEFRKSAGTGVYRFILLKRLQHARQLILSGAGPGDASRESGFIDYANFYRSFRAVYGISPKDAAQA
ncbi:MAG: helix-turn-helix domain-containing protein [Lachnospiraceae bacterium]|nr:helix-turn-helix domain-containing protein [Lachnospiraceae bacterium]